MAGQGPLVSIVIPVYNGSNYLAEAIGSALAQTYGNIEVIVVNDGSTDDGKTESIAMAFGTSIKYVHKENGGVSSALNVGIRAMTGEYFSWLSHDDLYLPQRVELQLQEMWKYPEIKVSFCDTVMFKTRSTGAYGRRFAEEDMRSDRVQGALVFFKRWVYACSFLVHRACFDVIGGLNEELRTSQDIEFTLRLLASFEVLNTKLPLTLRRDHPESGYYSSRDAVLEESSRFIESLVAGKGLTYFVPGISDDVSRAKVYSALGDHVIYDERLATRYYRASREHWPSLLNGASYKLVVGNRATKFGLRAKSAVFRRFEEFVLRPMKHWRSGMSR